MRYLAHSLEDIRSMLTACGKASIEELFSSVSVQNSATTLKLPPALTELELKRELSKRAQITPGMSFLGGGVSSHFVPEIVSQLLLRSEWYTAYTPYQPEVSQGTLQAIFEFQTIVANLFGMPIANASMYDGATALSEALLMACRIRPQAKTVLLSYAIHPEYRQVCQTFLNAAGINIVEIPFDDSGATDLNTINNLVTQSGPIAAIAYQTPNFLGRLETQKELVALAHRHNALAIAATTEPVAFGLVSSPGTSMADICVGEGIGLCGHLSLGGPGVGLFATRTEYLRQMPGRLAGATLDAQGKRGFVLTLSTREQHIRREKATSNICTNQGLMALAFTMAMTLYGKKGFKELAQQNILRTLYLRDKIKQANANLAFLGTHFNETCVKFESRAFMLERVQTLAEQNIFAGLDLARWYPKLDRHLLISTTELHDETQIDFLVDALTR